MQQNLVHAYLKEDKVTEIFEVCNQIPFIFSYNILRNMSLFQPNKQFDTAAAINKIRVPQMLEHVNMRYGGGSGDKDVSMYVCACFIGFSSFTGLYYIVVASIVVTSNTIRGIAEKSSIFSPSRCKFSNHITTKGSAEGSLILARD